MTTLQPGPPVLAEHALARLVGIGSGMFNSPEHRRDDGRGARPPAGHRRRHAHDAPEHGRGDLDRVRARDHHRGRAEGRCCFKIFSGLTSGLSDAKLEPFIHNMHTALWVLAATSLVGAGVSLLRPAPAAERSRDAAPRRRARRERRDRHAAPLRIGEVARARRHHAAHDPLLRGDRAPARPPASASRGRHRALRRGRRRAPARAAAAEDLLGVSLDELASWSRPRTPARRCARSGARRRRRRAAPRDPRRGARPHRAPARAGPAPPRRARPARGRAAGPPAPAAQSPARALPQEA